MSWKLLRVSFSASGTFGKTYIRVATAPEYCGSLGALSSQVEAGTLSWVGSLLAKLRMVLSADYNVSEPTRGMLSRNELTFTTSFSHSLIAFSIVYVLVSVDPSHVYCLLARPRVDGTVRTVVRRVAAVRNFIGDIKIRSTGGGDYRI